MIENIYEYWKMLCKEKGTSISNLCIQVTGNSGNLATWQKGYMRSDFAVKCADILGVSVDYLLGRTPCPDINISGNTQNNINGDNNINVNNNDELAGELSSLLKQLDIRKRTELMTMIYNFVDNNKG